MRDILEAVLLVTNKDAFLIFVGALRNLYSFADAVGCLLSNCTNLIGGKQFKFEVMSQYFGVTCNYYWCTINIDSSKDL